MVLSKRPITAARYARFANNPVDEAMVTCKGFLEAIVELAGRPRLRVFDFHMTAGGNTAASPSGIDEGGLRAAGLDQPIT